VEATQIAAAKKARALSPVPSPAEGSRDEKLLSFRGLILRSDFKRALQGARPSFAKSRSIPPASAFTSFSPRLWGTGLLNSARLRKYLGNAPTRDLTRERERAMTQSRGGKFHASNVTCPARIFVAILSPRL